MLSLSYMYCRSFWIEQVRRISTAVCWVRWLLADNWSMGNWPVHCDTDLRRKTGNACLLDSEHASSGDHVQRTRQSSGNVWVVTTYRLTLTLDDARTASGVQQCHGRIQEHAGVMEVDHRKDRCCMRVALQGCGMRAGEAALICVYDHDTQTADTGRAVPVTVKITLHAGSNGARYRTPERSCSA